MLMTLDKDPAMIDNTLALIPHLVCRNAIAAADFYQKAFGAQAKALHKSPDGQLMHGELALGDATFYLGEEWPGHGCLGPASLGGSPVTLHLQVPDCEAVFRRAVEAGCEVTMPLEDMFWGDRYGVLTDPYGHRWSVATTVREVSAQEMEQAMAKFCSAAAMEGTPEQ